MTPDSLHQVDENLAVRLTTSEIAYITGSCHTFPGRLSVWVPSDERSRCVSKSDIADAPVQARYWIQGFLAGSVPPPPEDPSLEAVWLQARAEFLETGEWRAEGL
jgi:hypothetical protein